MRTRYRGCRGLLAAALFAAPSLALALLAGGEAAAAQNPISGGPRQLLIAYRTEPADRPAFIEEVREVLRPQLCDRNGKWTADYTRLRFAAHRAD